MKKWYLISVVVIIGLLAATELERRKKAKMFVVNGKQWTKMQCDGFLGKGKEPDLSKNEYAKRRYYHCVTSGDDKQNKDCYKKVHDDIADCLASRRQKMSEEDILMKITGGLMVEICSDINKKCAENRDIAEEEYPPDTDEKKKFMYAMEKTCQINMKRHCQELNLR